MRGLRWHHAAFGLANLVLFTPSVYLLLGLPLIMRQHGWSGTEIGLFQLVGLPSLLKFLLAMPVQRWGGTGERYGAWAWWLGGGYVLTLLALSWVDIDTPRPLLFLLATAAALMSTWVDIPVNAAAFRMMPEQERMRAGGIRSAALFAGGILGGGVMLLVQQAYGWAAPFILMAVLVLAVLWLLYRLGSLEAQGGRHTDLMVSEVSAPAAALPVDSVTDMGAAPLWPGRALRDFFGQPGAWRWAWLLLAYFPLLAAAWVFLKPMLLDRGFSAAHVAWIAGVMGGSLGACASLLVARWVRAGRTDAILPVSAFCNVMVLALMALAVWLQAARPVLLGLALLLGAAMGVTSALVFGLMMDFARHARQAVDYGIQSSLFGLGRVAMPPVAGVLVDTVRYEGMLACLALGAGVVFLAALRGCGAARAVRTGGTG
ncbi:MAG: MFS transporter [Corticimicrobacter sp.]|uniref:MFS transporter n=1 Tax=Corticimicrobacter sp. TaxID=2678536 RepID=UPI0032DA8F28